MVSAKTISIIIVALGALFLSPKREQIALSNLFSNEVKRDIRNKYSYKRDYWLEVK